MKEKLIILLFCPILEMKIRNQKYIDIIRFLLNLKKFIMEKNLNEILLVYFWLKSGKHHVNKLEKLVWKCSETGS